MQYKMKELAIHMKLQYNLLIVSCHGIIKPPCLPKETSITKMLYMYNFDTECKTKCNFRNNWLCTV